MWTNSSTLILASLALFASVWIGVGLAFLLRRNSGLGTNLLLAFSGSFLFAVSVLHLIPELYEGHSHTPGIFILIGFISQFLLDFLSRGVEHGHHHSSDLMKGALPVGIFAGLFIHAFMEGLPVHGMDDVSIRSFVLAVSLHKLPVAMVLFLLLKEAEISKNRIGLSILLFALMAPFGAITIHVIPVLQDWMPHITAFVIGIFLHVSTTILYESSKDHSFNRKKLFVVVGGALLAWLAVQH